MKPIRFTGELYSDEHYQRFKATDTEVRLEKGNGNSGSFRLLLNKVNIIQWFRLKHQEFLKMIGIKVSEKQQEKGIRIK